MLGTQTQFTCTNCMLLRNLLFTDVLALTTCLYTRISSLVASAWD